MLITVATALLIVVLVAFVMFLVRDPDGVVRPNRTGRKRPMSKMAVAVRTIGVGGRYLAVANLGGITLTGPSCDDEVTAVQSLFWQMGPNAQLTQAPVAIALALNGQTLADLADEDQKALEEGDAAS